MTLHIQVVAWTIACVLLLNITTSNCFKLPRPLHHIRYKKISHSISLLGLRERCSIGDYNNAAVQPNNINELGKVSFTTNIFKSALALSLAILLPALIQPACADDGKLKESKQFELCMTKCVFAETRPPPTGSSSERLEARKPRSEIIRDCKRKCAVTQDQLLLGKPKQKTAAVDATEQ